MIDEKEKFDYLDLVFPLCSVYTCYLCFYGYFIDNTPEGTMFDVILLCIISFVFLYGLMSIIRDLKRFGFNRFLKNITKIYKNER